MTLFPPPPDFGNGPVIGAGSWQIYDHQLPRGCDPGAFEFVPPPWTPENIMFMSEATGLIPTVGGG